MAAKTHPRALGLLCALLLHRYAVAYQIPAVYQVIIPQALESPLSRICYSVTLGERTYSALLYENWAPGYIGYSLYTQDRTGRRSSEKQSFPGRCYLQGTLDGVRDSYVALSACSGFRGFLQTEFYTYAIEPLKDSSTFQHLVYRLEDVHTVPKACFNIRPERTIVDEFYKEQQEKKGRHDAGRAGKERQIQLHVIVDHDLFLHHDENLTKVIDVVYSVLNMADAMFAPVYLKLVLVGLEVWNTKTIIAPSKNVHTFLATLGTWKVRNLADLKADMVVLLRKDGIDSVFGATYTGGICWNRNGVMFVKVTENVLPATAAQLAHELGHSLGIPHDTDSDCPCILSSCIMLQSGVITTSFSECSLKFYSRLVDQGGAYCLQPASIDLFITRVDNPFCGNRIVEGSEECDCGSIEECSRDPCCDDICKFKGSAQCSIGKCCRDCRFARKGTVCRKLSSVCDLSEYCNGTSDLCPPDVYMQDGSPCNHNNSYCAGNRCYDYGKHCKALFGKGAKVASRECFMAINTIGDEIGNCGFKDQNISPIKCEIDSAMCGRVQCNAVQIKHSDNAHLVTIQTSFGDESCLSIAHDYSMIDIGAVEDGAQCDVGKICLARKCVSISLLRFNCGVHVTCSGNGVCNSNHNCHCNYGWAPPDCKSRGYGGSIDSGPILFKPSVRSLRDFKIADPVSESSAGTQRVRQTFTNNLAIGLGITLPLVAVGAVLAVIFRQRIAALVK